MSINKVVISGYLGAVPELRMAPGGTSVLTFNIAVNERKRDRNGNWTDRPNWFKCTLFGARADSLARILTKGSKVAVSGRLRQDKWIQDDQTRYGVSIIADDIDIMSAKNSRTDESMPVYEEASIASQGSIYDEDIPF